MWIEKEEVKLLFFNDNMTLSIEIPKKYFKILELKKGVKGPKIQNKYTKVNYFSIFLQ